MNKFVAIVCDGELEVHATGDDVGGGYATLCGLDGADPGIGQEPGELPQKPKINCEMCIAIILSAKKYSKRDFYC